MKRQLILLTGFCLLTLCISHTQAQDNLKLANECFDKGDYECAKRYYNVLRLDAIAAGMVEKIEQCDKSIGILTIANFLFAEKNYLQAKVKYEELLTINPKDPHAIDRIALCNANISASNEGTSADKEVYLQNGNDFFKKGDYANALQNYNLYKSVNPQAKDIDELIKNVTYCQIHLDLAKALFEKNDFENASLEYYNVIQVSPSDVHALNQYSLCMSELEKSKIQPITAKTLSGIADHPDLNISILYNIGVKQRKNGRIVFLSGFSSTAVGVGIAFWGDNDNVDSDVMRGIGVCLALAGAITTITSVPIWASGKMKIKKATRLYNESMTTGNNPAVELKAGFTGNGISLAFTF